MKSRIEGIKHKVMTEVRVNFRFLKASICWYSISLGFNLGSYVSRLPDIKIAYGLTDEILSAIFVCVVFGAVCCVPLATYLNTKIGSRRSTVIGALSMNFILPFIGFISGGLPSLISCFFFWGIGLATTDISMNIQTSVAENIGKVSLMGMLYGVYGIGSVTGALVGGVFATYGYSILIHFTIMASVNVCLCLLFSLGLAEESDISISRDVDRVISNTETAVTEAVMGETIGATGDDILSNTETAVAVAGTTTEVDERGDEPSVSVTNLARSRQILLCLCLIGCLANLVEGCITDWSTIYFTEYLNASPLISTVGFAMFSICSSIGRFGSDYLITWIGTDLMLQLCGVGGSIGISIMILSPSLNENGIILAIIGLSIAGLVSSVGIPVVNSCASRIPGLDKEYSLSVIVSSSYIAFLIGPPIIGGLSSVMGGLRYSMIIVVCVLPFTLFIGLYLTHVKAKIRYVSTLQIDSFLSTSALNYQPDAVTI